MLTALAHKLLLTVPYLAFGLFLEFALNRRVVTWQARWINISTSVLYWTADVLARATIAVGIVRA